MSATPPPINRRGRKREQTADNLAATAFELFARHGYDKVTMEQIAVAADVAKRTLYNHFPVKEALLRHRFHAELAAAMPALFSELQALPDSIARLRAFLHRSAAFSEQHREYMVPYLHYRLSQPIGQPADTTGREGRSGLDRIFMRLVADGQAAGEFRDDQPAERLADSLEFLYLCAVMRWVRTPGVALTAEFDAMLDFFLRGAQAGRAA